MVTKYLRCIKKHCRKYRELASIVVQYEHESKYHK